MSTLKKVLVTGNRGFIAGHLTGKLLEYLDLQIYGINRSGGSFPHQAAKKTDKFIEIYARLDDEHQARQVIHHVEPDIIFHLAADQGKTPESFLNTISSTLFLLKHLQNTKPIKFVYISSSTVYGDGATPSYPCVVGGPTQPTSLYGAAKLAGESLVGAYSQKLEIQPLILRLVANVGPGATHGVLPDIIKKISSTEEELSLWGESPGARKQYMYVKDTVDIITELALNNSMGIFNVAPPDYINILEIAQLGMEIMRKDKPIKWLGKHYLEVGDNQLVYLQNNTGYGIPGSRIAIKRAVEETI